MKKLIFTMAVAMALMACDSKPKSADSDAEDQEDATEQTTDNSEEEEATEEKNVIKGELGLFDLRGPVKSFTVHTQWGDITRTFDENGFWLTHDGQPLSKVYPSGIERDEQGRIVKGKMDAEGNGDDYWYNPDGTELRYLFHYYDEATDRVNTFDDNGNHISTKVTEVSMESDGEPYEEKYKVAETDNHGNWTSRKVYGQYESEETRTIEYYE